MRQQTMHIFQNVLQKTDDWLKEFMETTGREDEQKAWQMLRGVMHVLRDRLTVDQCAHLSAQLPMLIRGMYFESWKPADQPIKLRSWDEFVQAVAEQLSDHPEIDPNQAIRGTAKLLQSRITEGQIDKIKKQFPAELAKFWATEN